jgi:hypothetical protein
MREEQEHVKDNSGRHHGSRRKANKKSNSIPATTRWASCFGGIATKLITIEFTIINLSVDTDFHNIFRDIFYFSWLNIILIWTSFHYLWSQDKLAQITSEIASKKWALSSALEIAKEMKERITVNNSKKSGLCIRCLNKKNLQNVLEFLGHESSAVAVCKYWRLCLKWCNRLEDYLCFPMRVVIGHQARVLKVMPIFSMGSFWILKNWTTNNWFLLIKWFNAPTETATWSNTISKQMNK